MLVIVPDWLSANINSAIDKALDGRPCGPFDRDMIFQQLLSHYDEHGTIPDFSLTANEPEGTPK